MKLNRLLLNTAKGSITVEAAIILPFIIIAVIAFAFIIRIYYVNDLLHNALSGAGREMGVYSLIYYETNAEELISGIERFSSSASVSDTFGDSWVTSSIEQAGKEATDYLRAQLALVPISKQLVKKHLETNFKGNVNEALIGLNIVEGFDGISFTESTMLADGRSIDITAVYNISFPFLANLLPQITIRQTASVCIWAGENGVTTREEEGQPGKNLWDLPNIKRGSEIRKLQGANLPFNFPVIARYESGTVTSIKSLNIDETYYKDSVSLRKKINGYINKLEEFNGDTSGEYSISSTQILRKELVLVIPETEVSMSQQSVINKCIELARSKGITLRVIKAYGKQGSGESDSGDKNENGNSSK